MTDTLADTLHRLEATIASRKSGDPEASYIASLFAAGREKITGKVTEEAGETVTAALLESDAALTGEAADLLFHLLVLLADRDIPLDAVLAELDRREGVSGLEEKASRKE